MSQTSSILRVLSVVHALTVLTTLGSTSATAQTSQPTSTRAEVPSHELEYGAFQAQFSADGTFAVSGEGWPTLAGPWSLDGDTLTVSLDEAPEGCDGPGRYRVRNTATNISFEKISDDCRPRTMVLDRSVWRKAGTEVPVTERSILVSCQACEGEAKPTLPPASSALGSWPSFRGPQASGVRDGQNLPTTWDLATGKNVQWKVAVPGLAHASPVVWGNMVFLATAVSEREGASFRPGLYGDGDASGDRSEHRFEVHALDIRTGKTLWSRVAAQAPPIDKRHIKSTYANATPATDGRVVVAAFGSQGVYAYSIDGELLWQADLGRLDVGAYDVPSYERGPASSPVLWHGLVLIQADNQNDSFVLALDAATGALRWKSERSEIPGWGTPTVVQGPSGPELVTNGGKLIRGYDPRTGEELWRLGGSSKITAPTPLLADGLILVASGRGPERPIFAIRPGSRGDLTLEPGQTSSEAIAWSRQRRGPYMPTPIAYRSILYVLGNGGILDAYDLQTGEELYRQRLEHGGSGFSGSPVASDGYLYLPSEDGDILVVRAGKTFEAVATNSMNELLMTTPAISEGALLVRTANSLVALGRSEP